MSQVSGSSVDLCGPSPMARSRSTPVPKAIAVYDNGKSFNSSDARYTTLVCQRAKAIAGISTKGPTPWSLFTLEKVYDEEGVTINARMVCVTCTTSLTTTNPSQSFKNHLNADKTGYNTMSSGHHFDKVSKKPKESRTIPIMRPFNRNGPHI